MNTTKSGGSVAKLERLFEMDWFPWNKRVSDCEDRAIRFHVRCCLKFKREVEIIYAQVHRSHGFRECVDKVVADELQKAKAETRKASQ